jgi:hypothetical protein
MNLDEQLKALNQEEGRVDAPPHLEGRVLAAFAAQLEGQRSEVRASKVRRFVWGWPVAAALAAGVMLGAVLTLWNLQRGPQPPTLRGEAVSDSVVLVVEPPGVQETVRVVRIRVARSALESLGIETVASQGGSVPSDSVEVDVLVGEDGVARGVRLAM